MKMIIHSWHYSEKELKGLASIGLKSGERIECGPNLESDLSQTVLRIFNTGLNVMIAHSSSHSETILVGVADDLFKTR